MNVDIDKEDIDKVAEKAKKDLGAIWKLARKVSQRAPSWLVMVLRQPKRQLMRGVLSGEQRSLSLIRLLNQHLVQPQKVVNSVLIVCSLLLRVSSVTPVVTGWIKYPFFFNLLLFFDVFSLVEVDSL